MLNTEYSGFVTRDFYQVIVEVKIPNSDSSITRDRIECMQKSRSERDKIVVNQLRKISVESEKNNRANPFNLSSENYEYYVGDFTWFLNGLFLFQEDYSDPKKCKFIYRIIEKNLFSRVQETQLTIPTLKKKKSPFSDQDGIPKVQGQKPATNSQQPAVPGMSK